LGVALLIGKQRRTGFAILTALLASLGDGLFLVGERLACAALPEIKTDFRD